MTKNILLQGRALEASKKLESTSHELGAKILQLRHDMDKEATRLRGEYQSKISKLWQELADAVGEEVPADYSAWELVWEFRDLGHTYLRLHDEEGVAEVTKDKDGTKVAIAPSKPKGTMH